MFNFGWKFKADKLRMTLLSAGHQMARELPSGIAKILEVLAQAAKTGDCRGLQDELADIREGLDPRPLWEPAEIYGWQIQATFYLNDGALWWLVHAETKTHQTPSTKDIVFLDKVLTRLGVGDDPKRRAIICPTSSPPSEPPIPFGWWTWKNTWPLYEVQIHKDKRGTDMMRIVPLGSRPSDGYESLDLRPRDDLEDDRDADK